MCSRPKYFAAPNPASSAIGLGLYSGWVQSRSRHGRSDRLRRIDVQSFKLPLGPVAPHIAGIGCRIERVIVAPEVSVMFRTLSSGGLWAPLAILECQHRAVSGFRHRISLASLLAPD